MAKRSTARSGKSLVIVESPAKARTISKFLGRDFTVEASIGHVRDLPQKAARDPGRYRKEQWSRLGVNVDNDFAPLYIVPPGKTAQVRKLKGLVKEAKDLYLATDEDREGEAISWHLNELLKPKVPVHRLVFHEITKEAIERGPRAPATDRRRPGQSSGDAADRRSALWLRSLAAVVEEGAAEAFGRPRAKRRRAADRRTRAAADGFP